MRLKRCRKAQLYDTLSWLKRDWQPSGRSPEPAGAERRLILQFENTFSVVAPIERVWTYLLDVEQVAPCLPGAELTETVSSTEYKGAVKVKLGAMQVSYRGTLVLNEIDESGHRIVMTATGSETRGTGGASGTVTSTLTAESPTKTNVVILSEVNITGRVAQFGRNIMQDVSNKLIREFAQCLETRLSADQTAASTPSAQPDLSAPESGVAATPDTQPEREPATAGGSPAGSSIARPIGTPPVQAASSESPAGQSSYGATELKVVPLLLDVTRSRLATGLRKVAELVDPEKSRS
jgi:carbon monoxide dehydrogenase subunit G